MASLGDFFGPAKAEAAVIPTNPQNTDIKHKVIGGYDLKRCAEDPGHTAGVADIYAQTAQVKDASTAESIIKSVSPDSPITGKMIFDAADKHKVDPGLLLALFQWESSYGTKGLAAKTRNPGNIGGDSPTKEFYYDKWDDGVAATAKWLAKHRAKV
jgi:hypothetical protein